MRTKHILATIAALFCITFTFSQNNSAPKNWFHLDLKEDGFPGISSEKAYEKLAKGKKGEKVIVAVLDSGVDIEHEDLKDIVWTNVDEIPNNGIDDDKNGYIDDIHGWNFIGNKSGENVQFDNLEMTRVFATLKKKFEGKNRSDLSKKEKVEYDQMEEFQKVIDGKVGQLGPQTQQMKLTLDLFIKIEEEFDGEEVTEEKLKNLKTEDPILGQVSGAIISMMGESGLGFADLKEEIESYYNYLLGQQYHYDTELDSRKIVGDNYSNPFEMGYGNNDVEGPDAEHGTHVAGIIGASRGNGIGMNGVATNVEIMSVRTVPDGDERDKDVANAIRYAVDNGATVINMSFGKGLSPRKSVVDAAIKYALKHDVLLVHAAGNDGKENTIDNNFPNDKFKKSGLFGPKYAKNWLEVGALNWKDDKNLPAGFSNYSGELVDVFAPGMQIYSTVPNDRYKKLQGTSMAAPVVAGMAAQIRSYFPDLTAEQVKEIILQSSNKDNKKVYKPGTNDLVSFSKLSMSGGTANLYEAIRLAETVKGKKKNKNKGGSSGSGGSNKKKNNNKKSKKPVA